MKEGRKGTGEKRRRNDEERMKGGAYKGTFEFSRGDWTGVVSCAKQERKGNGEKERRGCIRRDLIRDSRHLNSLFRFSSIQPRLSRSSPPRTAFSVLVNVVFSM